MALSGVRNSWLTAARKRVLASLAVTASAGLVRGLGAQPGFLGDVARLDENRRKARAPSSAERGHLAAHVHELLALGKDVRALEPDVDGRLPVALAKCVDRLQEDDTVGNVDLLDEAAARRIAHPGQMRIRRRGREWRSPSRGYRGSSPGRRNNRNGARR